MSDISGTNFFPRFAYIDRLSRGVHSSSAGRRILPQILVMALQRYLCAAASLGLSPLSSHRRYIARLFARGLVPHSASYGRKSLDFSRTMLSDSDAFVSE
jgi:hypothetical protein